MILHGLPWGREGATFPDSSSEGHIVLWLSLSS